MEQTKTASDINYPLILVISFVAFIFVISKVTIYLEAAKRLSWILGADAIIIAIYIIFLSAFIKRKIKQEKQL